MAKCFFKKRRGLRVPMMATAYVVRAYIRSGSRATAASSYEALLCLVRARSNPLNWWVGHRSDTSQHADEALLRSNHGVHFTCRLDESDRERALIWRDRRTELAYRSETTDVRVAALRREAASNRRAHGALEPMAPLWRLRRASCSARSGDVPFSSAIVRSVETSALSRILGTRLADNSNVILWPHSV